MIVRQIRRIIVDSLDYRNFSLGEVSDLSPDSPLTFRSTSFRRDEPYRTVRTRHRLRLRLGFLYPLRRSLSTASRTGSPRGVRSLEVALRVYARRWFLRSSVEETISRTPKVTLLSSSRLTSKFSTDEIDES